MSFFLRKKNWHGIFHPYQKVYTQSIEPFFYLEGGIEMENLTGHEVFMVNGHCDRSDHKELYNTVIFSTYDKAEKFVLNIVNQIDGLLDKLPISNSDTIFSVSASHAIYIWTIRKLKIDYIVNEYGKEIEL